jgi:hypothetical protein
MKILKSLDNGGKWIYAPSVPFIENLLPKDEFSVQRIQINELVLCQEKAQIKMGKF